MKLFSRKGKPVRLETERFVLTTTNRRDIARHSFPWTTDPEIMHPMGYGTKWTMRKWRRTYPRFNNRTRFCFAIRPKGSDTVIGYERITMDRHGNAILTVMIGDRGWWGKGTVQETRRAVIDFAFGTLGCARLAGYVLESNYPSIANYQMLGFQCEGVNRKLRRNLSGKGRLDMIIFSQLAEEWQALREKERAS